MQREQVSGGQNGEDALWIEMHWTGALTLTEYSRVVYLLSDVGAGDAI